MLGLIAYTFVTMVGGNPEHWAYGFTYWKNPVRQTGLFPVILLILLFKGAFVEYLAPGNTGRFLGFVSCIIQGSFTSVSTIDLAPLLLWLIVSKYGRSRVHRDDSRRIRESSQIDASGFHLFRLASPSFLPRWRSLRWHCHSLQ